MIYVSDNSLDMKKVAQNKYLGFQTTDLSAFYKKLKIKKKTTLNKFKCYLYNTTHREPQNMVWLEKTECKMQEKLSYNF